MAKEKRSPATAAIQIEVGKRIRWARELVEPNRAKFARLMGIDRSTLQKIEDGTRTASIFNVMEIAHRLQVTPDYILKGEMGGVEAELRARLLEHHPELWLGHNRRATDDGT